MPICLFKQSKTVKQSKFATNSPVFFIFKIKAQESLKIYLWGKFHFVLGLLARDIASHSYAQNTHLTQALNPLRQPWQLMAKILPRQRWWMVWGLRFWRE